MVDIIIGLIFCSLSAVIFFRVQQYPKYSLMEGLGPGFMPSLLMVILFILSLVLIVTGVINKRRGITAENIITRAEIPAMFAPTMMLVSIFVYLVLLKFFGFLITTPILMFTTMKIMRAKIKESIIVAVGLTLAIYALFHFGFQVALPIGLLL